MSILIRWHLMKLADLDLHCFQKKVWNFEEDLSKVLFRINTVIQMSFFQCVFHILSKFSQNNRIVTLYKEILGMTFVSQMYHSKISRPINRKD